MTADLLFATHLIHQDNIPMPNDMPIESIEVLDSFPLPLKKIWAKKYLKLVYDYFDQMQRIIGYVLINPILTKYIWKNNKGHVMDSLECTIFVLKTMDFQAMKVWLYDNYTQDYESLLRIVANIDRTDLATLSHRHSFCFNKLKTIPFREMSFL